MEKLLSLREAAERLNVSIETVRRIARRGELSAVRVGVQVRIPERVIERYLEQRSAYGY